MNVILILERGEWMHAKAVGRSWIGCGRWRGGNLGQCELPEFGVIH